MRTTEKECRCGHSGGNAEEDEDLDRLSTRQAHVDFGQAQGERGQHDQKRKDPRLHVALRRRQKAHPSESFFRGIGPPEHRGVLSNFTYLPWRVMSESLLHRPGIPVRSLHGGNDIKDSPFEGMKVLRAFLSARELSARWRFESSQINKTDDGGVHGTLLSPSKVRRFIEVELFCLWKWRGAWSSQEPSKEERQGKRRDRQDEVKPEELWALEVERIGKAARIRCRRRPQEARCKEGEDEGGSQPGETWLGQDPVDRLVDADVRGPSVESTCRVGPDVGRRCRPKEVFVARERSRVPDRKSVV